jgi:hypothetical protein
VDWDGVSILDNKSKAQDRHNKTILKLVRKIIN